ncbi:hypothetical protein BJX62DRAFT_245209 [Aspergillus germanicus]
MPVSLNGHGAFRSILAGLLGLTVALFILFHINEKLSIRGFPFSKARDTVLDQALGSRRCQNIPRANDTLVILRTGATAARKRLPVHFETTLRCVPDYVIFSDMEEDFDGHHIHDVLSSISPAMQESAPEFAFYREIHQNKHRLPDFIEENSDEKIASSFQRKAWDLDKWKFLPSVQRAFDSRPDTKWFVFIEDDTFVVWSSLLSWLEQLDWREPHFLGLPVSMEDQLFAYGGSGWVLSRAAIQRITEHVASVEDHYEELTNNSAYGDLVLGHVAEQAGVQLTGAWPLIQRETPSTMDYTKDIMCYAVVTFHHVNGTEVKAIWDVEQEIITIAAMDELPASLLHFDVFKHLVYPHLASRIDNWDNFSDGEEKVLHVGEGFGKCKQYCEEDPECMQFRVTARKCTLAHAVTLGWKADEGMNTFSGWMMERVAQVKGNVSCGGGKWDFDTLNR